MRQIEATRLRDQQSGIAPAPSSLAQKETGATPQKQAPPKAAPTPPKAAAQPLEPRKNQHFGKVDSFFGASKVRVDEV